MARPQVIIGAEPSDTSSSHNHPMQSRLRSIIAFLCLATVLSSQAGIFTFADFTRPAAGASTTVTADFVPNEGWSGTPPNTTAGENSLYLKATVSWTATATPGTNIGTFNVRFNQNDDASAPRLGMGKTGNLSGGQNAGFEFITSNVTTDPDGAGPATARPAIVPFDPSVVTSVTLVMKIDHTKAGTSPGGDWWFATEGLQSAAVGCMWINPDLNAPEESQFTPWAAWRSGNASYSGVSFITDTDAVDLTFSNIAIYTGDDTPFATSTGVVSATNSTVSASPLAVPANGTSTSTITVTLRDSGGLLITGEGVTLAGSPAGAAISPAGAQVTNGTGQAVFTVKSTTIGSVVFTATSSTDNVTVTQSANVNFTDPQDAEAFNVKFLEDNPPQANATGLVGVVGAPGETWNQGYQSVSNLVDTTGTVISSVGVSGLGNDGRLISGTGLSVFNSNRNLLDKGADLTMSITGLTPNTAYDFYIYALSHNTGSWGDIANTERAAGDFVTTNTVLGNGQSQWLDNAVAGTNGNAFLPNANYVSFQSIVSNGSGNISIVVDAYDGLDGNPSTDDGDCRLHVCGLQIRPASGMSVDYMNWRNALYPGIGLPDDDDDGDGLSNEFEHIFGMNPASSASASPYPAPFFPHTGQFSYSRRARSLINLDYKVWYSTDLVNWFVDNAALQTAGPVTNGVEIMGVEIDPALFSEPKLFVQVRATPVTGIDLEPSLLNVRGNGNTITLLFSEPMNPSSASNPDNYAVTRDGVGPVGITGATLNPGGGSVTLTLASALEIDTAYTVSVAGVTSGTGQSLGGQINRALRTWDDDPNGIKVFILAGQSNMVGRGESERGKGDVNGAIGSLRYQVVNDNANYGQLVANTGNPAAAPWVVRSDVKFWWNRADIGAAANISKGGLNPRGFGSGPQTFGPEYGFGWAVGNHFSQPVLVIKTAWGGKSLSGNFRPPSAVANRGGVVGGYYIEMLEQVREILHNLQAEFPAAQHPEFAAVGYRYQIAGFGWHQGWNDSGSGDTFAANEYEANLANFITDIRADFGKPSLPFSIGTTGMEGAATAGNRLTVVNAQLAVANPAGNVFSVDTRPFAETTENSPTNDTTHWKNNGKSMYRIGKGMGDGMVGLLGGP
jgi:alpha-galactosidase